MTKRIEKQLNSFKYKGEPIKITLGTLVITSFCVLLLIIATFTQVTIYHPYIPLDSLGFLSQNVGDYDTMHHFIKKYQYIPQIPVIFFIFAGTLLKTKPDFLRILMIAAIGVLTIHILGILYMLFVATLRHAPMDLVTSWISSQSGIQIFYDIFFTVVSIYLGQQARKLLWIVMC